MSLSSGHHICCLSQDTWDLSPDPSEPRIGWAVPISLLPMRCDLDLPRDWTLGSCLKAHVCCLNLSHKPSGAGPAVKTPCSRDMGVCDVTVRGLGGVIPAERPLAPPSAGCQPLSCWFPPGNEGHPRAWPRCRHCLGSPWPAGWAALQAQTGRVEALVCVRGQPWSQSKCRSQYALQSHLACVPARGSPRAEKISGCCCGE